MIVHSGMLNNLSPLSLLIGAKNPKKSQTGRCLNINPTERHSATKHVCMPAHITARLLCLESSAFFKYIVMHL